MRKHIPLFILLAILAAWVYQKGKLDGIDSHSNKYDCIRRVR